MINIPQIKESQLRNGFLKIGSGPLNILLIGSCRSISYLNYFNDVNGDNSFTIHFIDPFKWNWDQHGNRVNLKDALIRCESDNRILEVLKSCSWFIHEYYESYEMFNTAPNSPKNIHQYGIKPEIDITIPNYDNIYILFTDVLREHKDLWEESRIHLRDNGSLSIQLQGSIADKGLSDVEKICRRFELFSDFPEMAQKFRYEWRNVRYFWTTNHVSSQFTVAIFRMMMGKLPGLKVPESMWNKWLSEDMFSSPCTPVTKYDVDNYALKWNIPLSPLVLPHP